MLKVLSSRASSFDACCSLPFMALRGGIPWDKGRAGEGMGWPATSPPLAPIPLSALQHWAYCPRQCALIHLEQAFEENIFTLRGQAVHTKADQPGVELRAGLRGERALPVFCDRLGLGGKPDVVEFLPDGTPYPVEYKHGSRNKKAGSHDRNRLR